MEELVIVKDLKVHQDDRGYLFEVIHNYELPKKGGYYYIENSYSISVGNTLVYRFGQVYVVGDPVRGTIRGLHRHKELWDYFCILNGSAKFVFVDGEGKNFKTVVLSAKCPQMIIVPPTVYHGWKSLEDNTIMMSTASELYNKDNPDEERVPYNQFEPQFGDLWKEVIK